MARYKDIVGEKFGRLTVIAITNERTSDGSVVWQCQCDCGTPIKCSTKKLRSGNTKSCGCLQKEIAGARLRKDLTNQRFGSLIALAPTTERKHGSVVWDCICDCGNKKPVTAELLLNGHTKSCGCIRSRGNQKVKSLLQSMGLNFVSEYFITIDRVRYAYDFALLKEGKVTCFIEYDGVLHFEQDQHHGWNNQENWEKTQRNDEIKNQYAKEHNISLIRIPYTEYNEVNEKYLIERIGEYV